MISNPPTSASVHHVGYSTRLPLLHQEIQSVLDFCAEERVEKFVLALPFPVPTDQVAQLCQDSRISGLVLSNQDDGSGPNCPDFFGRLIPDAYTWSLPSVSASTIVFVGARSRLTFRMLKLSYLHGFRRVICCTPLTWVSESIAHLLFRRLCSYAAAKTDRFRRPLASRLRGLTRQSAGKHLYARFLAEAGAAPMVGNDWVPGRIVLVNSALAAGGAERQVVSTLKGMRQRGFETILMCENLCGSTGHGFFLEQVRDLKIPVRQVYRGVKPTRVIKDLSHRPNLFKLLNRMPSTLRDDVIDLYCELVSLKPEVVHAWQDSTSVKVGLAATLAGVPRVVLSSRNVSPLNFAYHQDYMKPAYQALADLPHMEFVNNSLAGAADYARWLGIPASRFRLIRNGLDLSSLQRAANEDIDRFRRQLGIPHTASVIGSVFRFWPEKRPLLWVEMAAHIAAKIPGAHFLVVGWGPQRQDMERLVEKFGLQERFHLLTAQNDIAVPVSAMDVFVLTSEFEGTPNVVIESQQLGVPVVATNAGGTAEAIEQGVTGWIVDPPSPSALAQQVLAVLDSPGTSHRARTRGPAFVKSTFSIDRMVIDTLQSYQTIPPRGMAVESNLVQYTSAPEKPRHAMAGFERPAFPENHIARVE